VPGEEEYVARAKKSIMEVLDAEHAVINAELEARISERNFEGANGNIDPHHVTQALREMGKAGDVIWEAATARGGHEIETIQPADQRRRATKITHAAARKRLLAARYTGWAQGTKRHPNGLIGPAGEVAVRRAILDAQTLQPAMPGAGEVAELLGTKLPGPADSAGYMVPLVNGIPGVPVTVVIEVKNIRSWIYPSAEELYQVLHKACLLQRAHQDQPIVPVLVCRKAHFTTFKMARQLGFFVIPMGRQFAGEVEEAEIFEIRTELHYQDLVRGTERSARVFDRLRKTLPPVVVGFSQTWRATCLAEGFAELFDALRKDMTVWDRSTVMTALRATADRAGLDGGW
jgi:hypothetical protein